MIRSVVLSFLLSSVFSLHAVAGEFRIATLNCEWLFDDDPSDNSQLGATLSAPNAAAYESRIRQFSDAIASMDLDVIALQEIEGQHVVDDIAEKIATEHSAVYQTAFVEGQDTFTGQNVAFLVRTGDGVVFAGDFDRFVRDSSDSEQPRNVSKHLWCKAQLGGEEVTFVTCHLIASNLNRRKQQAVTLRTWITPHIGENLVVLGDMNSRVSPGSLVADTDIGTIIGLGTPSTSDDLIDTLTLLPEGIEPETHVGGSPLDRVLLSPSLADNSGLRVANSPTAVTIRGDLAIQGTQDRGSSVDYSLPEDERDLSDHFPLVVTLTTEGGTEAEVDEDLATRIESLESQVDELRGSVSSLTEIIGELVEQLEDD